MSHSSNNLLSASNQCFGCQGGCFPFNVEDRGNSGDNEENGDNEISSILPSPSMVLRLYLTTLVLPLSGFIGLILVAYLSGFSELIIAVSGVAGLTSGIWMNGWFVVDETAVMEKSTSTTVVKEDHVI